MKWGAMGFEFQPSDLMMLISVSLMILAVRLLRIASQTRGTPELMLGLYLMISPPCTSLLMRFDRFAPEYQRVLEITADAIRFEANAGDGVGGWGIGRHDA